MSDKKSWAATVLGWFVVSEDGERREDAAASGSGAAPMPPVFVKDPPAALGGQVDFGAVFEAAGLDADQIGRVSKAQELVSSLPAETPAAVKRQIVEAALTAFGVDIDKIIESGVAEIRALEGYIRTGAAETQALLAESAERIAKFEDEIRRIRTVMDQRVQEQQAVTKACNEKKLGIQQILEFFGQEEVARVVHAASAQGSGGGTAEPGSPKER
ncbi:MAG TPA: hypothetical protein PLE61_04445 [Vicinamibacterales bacterium]|mgnify:FL=1|nr:hypothetical protein [Vicinamibacterales bacterium]HPW20045.1 hypothetical protein [Vicinamibacterales bacterium]